MPHVVPSTGEIVRVSGTDGLPVGIAQHRYTLFPYVECCGTNLVLGVPNYCPSCGDVYELECPVGRSVSVAETDLSVRKAVAGWLGVDEKLVEVVVSIPS